YLPGDRAQGVHFLTSGRIKISKVTRDGKELTLAYRSEGDFFGEPCLLDGGPREEMAEAMDASSTVEVPREALDDLLRNDGGAARERRGGGPQSRAGADRPPQGSRDARRAADIQRRGGQARRAPVEPGPGARRLRPARARGGPQDHPPGDGEPDRFDARDRLL